MRGGFRVNENAPGEQVENILQVEAGARYYADTFDVQLALFWNEFDPRQQTNNYRDFTDPSCAATALSNLDTCPLVENIAIDVDARVGVVCDR